MSAAPAPARRAVAPALLLLVAPALAVATVAGCSAKKRAAQVEEIAGPGTAVPEAGPPPKPGNTKLDAETHLAVGPDGSVMVAWIGYALNAPTQIGYEISRDGAATFEPRQGTFSPQFREASDPVIAARAAGEFFVTWIGFRRTSDQVDDGHVYLARLPPGAGVLDEPVEVSDPGQASFFDKPWITTTRDGHLLVSYAWFADARTGITVARSEDGRSWQRTTVAEDQAFAGNLAYVCAAPDGDRVWVTWWEPPGRIRARWSDDGGASWPAEKSLVVSEAGESVGFGDPGCVAAGTDAWFVYGISTDDYDQLRMPDLTALPIVHVHDGAIAARSAAHDPGAGAHYLLPQIVRESSGALDVSFYVGSEDGDRDGRLVYTRSAGAELGFGPARSIRDGVIFSHARDKMVWLGDYTGLAWRAGTLFSSHVDNSSGVAGIGVWRGAVP